MIDNYETVRKLLAYMKQRGVEKEEALAVILICKKDNQIKEIFNWMEENENIDNIVEKCLEIRETIT